MLNFEEQVKSIIKESESNIKQQVNEQIKQNIIDSLTWNLRDEVSQIVKETIVYEMKEDIKNIITDNQPLILEELRKAIIKISAEAGKGLVEKASTNLTHSWNVQKITEALFK